MYGTLEKKERKGDIKKDTAYMKKNFPQTRFREFEGYSHLEMVMCHPESFYREAMRFLKASTDRSEKACSGTE